MHAQVATRKVRWLPSALSFVLSCCPCPCHAPPAPPAPQARRRSRRARRAIRCPRAPCLPSLFSLVVLVLVLISCLLCRQIRGSAGRKREPPRDGGQRSRAKMCADLFDVPISFSFKPSSQKTHLLPLQAVAANLRIGQERGTDFRTGPKSAAPSPPRAPRAKGRARGAWPHPQRRWDTGRGETHGANPPVAPLKWGAAPHRIALGKTLAPCEEPLHPDGAGFTLEPGFSLP